MSDILVSTDSIEIADISRTAGAMVPWLRPEALATDTASSVDVAVHALDWYESAHGRVDGLLLLQPTSPFRRAETIVRGAELFAASGRRAVVSVSPAASHPMLSYRLDNDRDERFPTLRPFIKTPDDLRTQDFPPAYVLNGAIYLVSPQHLRERRSFLSGDMVPLVMAGADESVDIDTEADWQLAESILNSRA